MQIQASLELQTWENLDHLFMSTFRFNRSPNDHHLVEPLNLLSPKTIQMTCHTLTHLISWMMTKITKEVLFLELKLPQIIQSEKITFLRYLKDLNNRKSWSVLLTNLKAAKIFMELDRDLTLRPIVRHCIKIKKPMTIRMGKWNSKHKT